MIGDNLLGTIAIYMKQPSFGQVAVYSRTFFFLHGYPLGEHRLRQLRW